MPCVDFDSPVVDFDLDLVSARIRDGTDLKTYIGTPLFLCLLFYPIFACILVLFTYFRIYLLLLHRYGFQQRQEEEAGQPLGQAKGGSYWGEPFNAPNPFIFGCACFLTHQSGPCRC